MWLVLCQIMWQGRLGSLNWWLPNFGVLKNYLTVVKMHVAALTQRLTLLDYLSPKIRVQFCLKSFLICKCGLLTFSFSL